MELFPPNKHTKLQLFTKMENMDSEGSPSITDNTRPQNILIASEITHKQSMSDDEAYARFNTKNKLNRSYSHSTNDTNNSNDSFDADTISPLKLRDIQSANIYQDSKRRKQRSNSAMISSKGSRRRKQNSILQRQCRDLQSQLKIYQDKITDIQDDAEETEEAIRREFELRLLHLETKYLREKSEKKSLQSEVENLRQELFRRQASIGYSSATAATKSPVFHNNNQFYDTTNIAQQRPMIQAYNSNNTVVINSSNQNTPRTPNTINTNHSYDIIEDNQKIKKRANSSISSNSNSCSSSSSNSSTSSTNSSMSDTTSSYSSTNTNSTDKTESYMEESSHDTINMEKAKGKYSRIGGKRKYKGKQKKIPPKYKKNKTKSFWDNLWGLFAPPNLMCTTCSDNK